MCLCVCIYIYIDSYTQVTERMTAQRMSATNERALLKEQADQALVLTLTCTCARARARTHTHTHTHTQQELEAAKTGMHQKTLQIVRLQKQLRVAQTRADDFKQQATRLRQHQVDRPIEGVCMCGGAGGCRRTQLVFTHTCDTYIHI